MLTLDKIKEPVSQELKSYEEFLKSELHSKNPLVNTMLEYILGTRGKAVRPLMVLLSASIHKTDEKLPQSSLLAAMLLEMIHTASLIHDDILDEAFLRRGKPSVNALWRPHKAVLIGDYLLAQSYIVGMNSGEYELVRFITKCMSELCEGEITQSDQTDHLSMTRTIYNSIIYNKTASLIGRSCAAGAMSVGSSAETVARMKEMGDDIGMAFQIKDDILDYTPSSKTGKPACGDIRERKITLPLLTVLERSTKDEKRRIIKLLSEVGRKPENVGAISEIVISRGGLEMAETVLNEYLTKANEILDSFPNSVYKDAMKNLFSFIASRES